MLEKIVHAKKQTTMFFQILTEENLRKIAAGFPAKSNLSEPVFVVNDHIQGIEIPYGYFNASLTDNDILTSPNFFVAIMERGTKFVQTRTDKEDEYTRKEYLAVVVHISGEYAKGLYLAEKRGQPNILMFEKCPLNAVVLIPYKRNMRENKINIMVTFTREGLTDVQYERSGEDEVGVRQLLDVHQN